MFKLHSASEFNYYRKSVLKHKYTDDDFDVMPVSFYSKVQ